MEALKQAYRRKAKGAKSNFPEKKAKKNLSISWPAVVTAVYLPVMKPDEVGQRTRLPDRGNLRLATIFANQRVSAADPNILPLAGGLKNTHQLGWTYQRHRSH